MWGSLTERQPVSNRIKATKIVLKSDKFQGLYPRQNVHQPCTESDKNKLVQATTKMILKLHPRKSP